jgi:hypothetical protein
MLNTLLLESQPSEASLPTDEEAAESAAEQRALMASFETQRRDEAAWRLRAAERRAAADDLAAAHQSAYQSAYLRNLAAMDAARAAAAGRRPHEDRTRVEAERRLQAERARAVELARVREHQYPLPSTTPTPASQKMPQHRRQQLRASAGSSCVPPPSPGDRQPWQLRWLRRGRFRCGRLRRAVVVGSITRSSSGIYSA